LKVLIKTAVRRLGLPRLHQLLSIGSCCAFACLAPGCRKSERDRGGAASAEQSARPAIARGDRVVVEAKAAEFFEGRVLAVDGERLRVQRAAEGDALSVALSDAYRLPPASAPVAPGQLAICRAGEARWVGCRIEARSEAGTRARSADGAVLETASDGVIPPTAVTALNLERHFERSHERAEFQNALSRAGAPRRPDGWRASPRERVVARQDGSWYSASVHEIEDDGLYVTWQADRRTTKLEASNIVPEPPYAHAPKRGEFALLRPETIAQPWKPVRIDAAAPDAFTVVDVSGKRQPASARDLLPLAR
jgi:hypothetical protein